MGRVGAQLAPPVVVPESHVSMCSCFRIAGIRNLLLWMSRSNSLPGIVITAHDRIVSPPCVFDLSQSAANANVFRYRLLRARRCHCLVRGSRAESHSAI